MGYVARSLQGLTGPWFRERPRVALAVAVCLFAGVTVLRWFYAAPGDATSVLYVFPIALLAVTFGLRGGLAGAAAGFGLFVVIWTTDPGGVPPFGWVVRGAGMFLMGSLLGHATDRIYAHERTTFALQRVRYELQEENRRYAEATEIGDSILQHLVVTKWLIEQGRTTEASELLTATIERGQELVSDLVPRTMSSRVKSIFSTQRASKVPRL